MASDKELATQRELEAEHTTREWMLEKTHGGLARTKGGKQYLTGACGQESRHSD